MPNVIIEAQGLGIPCISSDCPPGGPAYLIHDNETGLLFKNDDVSSLVEKLCFALDDDDRMKEISKMAYKRIYINHNPDKIFNEWEKFIIQTVKG